jgi:hypothetical protein
MPPRRDTIDASRIPRMTPQHSSHREHDAMTRPVQPDRLRGVRRTARFETAPAGEHRREGSVNGHHPKQETRRAAHLSPRPALASAPFI